MRFQAWHIIVLVIVILLVFGSARLPEMASSIGKSLKVFKKEITELKEDVDVTPPAAQGTPGSTPPAYPANPTGGAPAYPANPPGGATHPANPTDVNPDGTPRT